MSGKKGGDNEQKHLCCMSFDSHGGKTVQYRVHYPMQHDQGFAISHWTPPLGDYSLCIAPAAARATINTTIMHHIPTLMVVLMAIAMRRYYTVRIARWRRFVAFIKATKRRHRASNRSNSINWTCLPLFQGYISLSNCWKRAWAALIPIGVWHIKLMRST